MQQMVSYPFASCLRHKALLQCWRGQKTRKEIKAIAFWCAHQLCDGIQQLASKEEHTAQASCGRFGSFYRDR